jgi:hypothetical protein
MVTADRSHDPSFTSINATIALDVHGTEAHIARSRRLCDAVDADQKAFVDVSRVDAHIHFRRKGWL